MTRITPTDDPVTDASRLDLLVAEMSARVETGQAIDLTALTADCPEHREQLEMLLPTLQAVVDLERSVEEGGAGSARSPVALEHEHHGNLGDFRLIREIGRGGMGVVYEAEQISLGRRVAVKVLPFAAMLDERQQARFKNEARAAASLNHPHIVPVHYVGAERGVNFYAMQFIEGQSLAEIVANAKNEDGGAPKEDRSEAPDFADAALGVPPSALETRPVAVASTLPNPTSPAHFRRIAELGVQAAGALHYAHESGVIHRDVKPSNLLVDDRGHLWVADFGLARIGADPALTMTGDLLGTLRYMSPEQLCGKSAMIDHRTDVYSLGVTLYELLTRRPAFAAESSEQLIQQILTAEPLLPRSVDGMIPADLQTIVLKAMRCDGGDRYASAIDLADDLRRFVDHKPILARPVTRGERARKWLQRHSYVVWSLTVILFFAAVGSAISAWLVSREWGLVIVQLAETERNRRRADDNFSRALSLVGILSEGLNTPSMQDDPRTNRVHYMTKALIDEFLQPFAESRSKDPSVRLHSGMANNSLANLYTSNGDAMRARESYLRASQIFRELTIDFPDNPLHFSELVHCEANIGCHLFANGDPAGSQQHFEDAADSYRRLRALTPDGRNFPFWYSSLSATRGAVGLPPLLDARDLLAHYGNGPDSPRYWHIWGPIHYRQGRWQEAADALVKSIDLTRQKYPLQYVSDDRLYLAMAYWQLGRAEEARTQLARANQEDQEMRVWYEDNALLHAEAAALIQPADFPPEGRQ